MPDLDLEPHEYGPTGKRRAAIPDDPIALGIGIVIGLAMLGYAFWHRAEMIRDGDPAVLFFFVALVAACTGGAFTLLLKRLRID